MSGTHRFVRTAFGVAAVFAVSSARGDTEPGARAVIRGSGNDVQIVYRSPRPAAAPRAATDTLDEALQRKRAGDSDQAVLTFLGLHRAEMPSIVGSDLLRNFRRAGAGDTLIAFLSSSAAVEIGPTAGDAAAPPAMSAPEPEPYAGAYPDLVSSGYPFYGAYGYGGFGGYGGLGGHLGRGRMHHGFFKGFGGRNGGFHFGFGSGFGPHPKPHPMPVGRGGGATHAAITGGRMR